MNCPLFVMGDFRPSEVGAQSSRLNHITTRWMLMKFLRLGRAITILVGIIALASSIATTAKALPRPARSSPFVLGSKNGSRSSRRFAWRSCRANSGTFYSTKRQQTLDKGKMSWKEASLTCSHFVPVFAEPQPAKVASFVCCFGRSFVLSSIYSTLRFACFVFSVFAGGLVGVLLLLIFDECLAWSAWTWRSIPELAQRATAISALVCKGISEVSRVHRHGIPCLIHLSQSTHSVLLVTNNMWKWLFLSPNVLETKSAQFFASLCVRMRLDLLVAEHLGGQERGY